MPKFIPGDVIEEKVEDGEYYSRLTITNIVKILVGAHAGCVAYLFEEGGYCPFADIDSENYERVGFSESYSTSNAFTVMTRMGYKHPDFVSEPYKIPSNPIHETQITCFDGHYGFTPDMLRPTKASYSKELDEIMDSSSNESGEGMQSFEIDSPKKNSMLSKIKHYVRGEIPWG